MLVSVLMVTLLGLLSGCSQKGEEISFEKQSALEEVIPTVLLLEDGRGRVVGKAIPFEKNIYITPDHLWQKTGKLYFEGKPIEVLVRDFRHDVLFFTLKKELSQSVSWHNVPPSLGQKLYWFDGFQIHKTTVLGVNESFIAEDKIINLMSVEGKLEPGDSGTPLFDDRGNIYGMLISTDVERKRSYFVRADIIRELSEEYLKD